MERRKFELGYYWDFITSFQIYTKYFFNGRELAEELKDRLMGGVHFKSSIQIKPVGHSNLYTISFAHTKDEDIKKKAQSLLDILKEIESDLEVAEKLDRMRGLLNEGPTNEPSL